MTVVSSMASSGSCDLGAPWRDLPDIFGPYTTCYNRFVRWRRAGVWVKLMTALASAHDAAVQMIDTSIIRVHQHGECITRNRRQAKSLRDQPLLDIRLKAFRQPRRIVEGSRIHFGLDRHVCEAARRVAIPRVGLFRCLWAG